MCQARSFGGSGPERAHGREESAFMEVNSSKGKSTTNNSRSFQAVTKALKQIKQGNMNATFLPDSHLCMVGI